MTTRHLTAWIVAMAAFAIGAVVALFLNREAEARYVHTLAYARFAEKNLGTALQTAAFDQVDLLPVYGSSEIVYDNPYHASHLFLHYPTGFRIFPVATLGATPLMHLQRLAGLGSSLRGRKVVISIVPDNIYRDREKWIYVGNFSRLQATALIFNLALPYPLKQRAAKRLLDYPETLESDDLLRTAIGALADDSVKGRALYTLLVPLGKLQEWTLRLIDHWEVLAHAKVRAGQPELPNGRVIQGFNWPTLAADAQRVAAQQSNTNSFGINNEVWQRRVQQRMQPHGGKIKTPPIVRRVASGLQSPNNWSDLDLLLDALEVFGARPLLLSAPFSGRYYDFWGVNSHQREAYYEMLHTIAARHQVPVLDFEDHDEDTLFVIDASSHLSAKAWVYYDRAMDDFFHDRPLTELIDGPRQ